MGTKIRVGGFGVCSSSSLSPEKMPLGPTGRGEVGSGSASLLVQGPLLAGALVMAPRIEAAKSESGLYAELRVVPSDSGAGLQPLIHSLNGDNLCPRGCRPERSKLNGAPRTH